MTFWIIFKVLKKERNEKKPSLIEEGQHLILYLIYTVEQGESIPLSTDVSVQLRILHSRTPRPLSG
jgi:hypothetical protein